MDKTGGLKAQDRLKEWIGTVAAAIQPDKLGTMKTMAAPGANATREHWDALAGDYDRAKARNAAYWQALVEIARRFVPPQWRGRLLEVGCGTGAILASLDPHTGVGIDLSEKMILHARRTHGHKANLSFHARDGTQAHALGEFDAVICFDVLEHVEDWPAVVSSLVKAAAPGAVIVIVTPNPSWALPLWVLEKLRLKMPEGPHRFVPRRAIAAALESQGCEVMHMGTAMMVPSQLGGAGPIISSWAATKPILRSMGVIQIIAAAKVGAP